MEEGCKIRKSSSPLRSQAQKVHEQVFNPHLDSSEAQAVSTSLRDMTIVHTQRGTERDAFGNETELDLSAQLQLNSL